MTFFFWKNSYNILYISEKSHSKI